MERRTYAKEFKQEAVELSQQREVSVAQVARELGVRPELLYRWRGEMKQDGGEAFPGKGQQKAGEEEMRQLQRELERVRMERDILKKALSVFARPGQ